MTNITIDLEKLTEDQLEAFKVINAEAVKKEQERRVNESIYTEEEVKSFKIFSDLSKAYFFLKPMYDNMRNNDVKKTITSSEILPVLEKVFRYAKAKNLKYVPYQPAVEEEAAQAQVEEKLPLEEAIDKAVAQEQVPATAPAPAPAPAPEPVTPEAITPVIPPIPSADPRPIVQPLATPVMVLPVSAVPPMPKASSVDIANMSPEEINAVMQNIPVIPNI